MNQDTCIEIVRVNGVLRQAFIIDKEDERIAELPLRGIRESGGAGEMAIVTLELHGIRVKHTDLT